MAEDGSKKSTYIKLSLEFLSSFDRTRKSEDLTTANLFTLDATEQSTHVVTGLSLSTLVRYLQCRNCRLDVRDQVPCGTSLLFETIRVCIT